MFVIVTDGLENHSKPEYTRERLMAKIKHQTEVYNWVFLYLGADQDAIAVAASYGKGVDADISETLKWLQKSAEQNYKPARQASDYIVFEQSRKEAEQGDVVAQFRLGMYYFDGIGVTKDLDMSWNWLKKSAEQGYEPAQQVFHNLLFIQSQEAAEQGDAKAQCDLGVCYFYGLGVAKDLNAAVKWIQKSQKQDYEPAGRVLDYLVFTRIREVAEQGDAKAQRDLGECYFYGFGVAKDLNAAVKWLQKSAEQNYEPARQFLESMVDAVGTVLLHDVLDNMT